MKYKFEINDLRCILTLLNIGLILKFDIRWGWFGVLLAALGIIKDYMTDKKISSIIMHSANLIFYILVLDIF